MPESAHIGPYRILDSVAGDVFQASDTRDNRAVAIRRLPSGVRPVALEHPNIAAVQEIIHHDGHDFLVRESLEGGTLAARIEGGPLAWEEALQIAIPVAEALHAAHRAGVLHGALKPSVVVLAASGPKILDFGLTVSNAAAAQADTVIALPAGSGGNVLDSLRYMAPEQLEGLAGDVRTDIYAFGLLLHEMLTGRRTFDGQSKMLLVSAITTVEPEPVTRIQPATPAAVDHFVQVCLAKDPNGRWQTAYDLLAELKWIAAGGGAPAVGAEPQDHAEIGKPSQTRNWLSYLPLAAAGFLLAAVALPAGLYFQSTDNTEEIRLPVPSTTASGAPPLSTRERRGRDAAISPDGRSAVYLTHAIGDPAPFALYVLPFGSISPRKLPGTDEATYPFWSADSRYIGFVTAGKLKKVAASGGPPQEICDAADFSGGTWNSEGVILFGSTKGLFRVSAEGGKPEAVTSPDAGETGHLWPHFLPGGNRYLFTAWSGDASKRAIVAGTLGSKERVRVMAGESNAAYSARGYLLFHRQHAVFAQPFDAKKLALSGEPARVADEVQISSQTGRADFSASVSGSLFFFQEPNNAVGFGFSAATDDSHWRLVWADRAAKLQGSQGPDGPYRGFEISPDGKRIAVHRHDKDGGDVLVIEPDNSVKKLTFSASHHNTSPVWSPKGDRIAYSALQKGKWGIYQTLSNGSGTEELVYESEARKAPMSWSPDGKSIVFWLDDSKNSGDLWVLSMDDKKAQPLIATTFNETHAQISPDGRWIAYTSNLTGRNEIHVQPFPSGSGHWQVSFHGGDWPRWKGDGKELIFHSIAFTLDTPPALGVFLGPLFSVPVTTRGNEFVPGNPKNFVRNLVNALPHSGGEYSTYAISQDGQRILSLQTVVSDAIASTGAGPDPGGAFVVVQNWEHGLKK